MARLFAGREQKSRRGVFGKASFFVKLALLIIVIILIIRTVVMIMEYAKLAERTRELKAKIAAEEEKIDELNYYINSPIDEHYVRKFARELLGLVPSNEKVIITDPGN
ncbi:MAG: septum formation initiator family protein [Clostridia bacterium]|nr:septum formation initiator family protein [Clostridia bacterium]MBP5270717.1 septum formation initiator family protein [Clostridia bacterium]